MVCRVVAENTECMYCVCAGEMERSGLTNYLLDLLLDKSVEIWPLLLRMFTEQFSGVFL